MNKYVGKICPYCKTAIKENDEIVVCSVCDMPHHKDCWVDNQGCTTFGCTGTISTPEDNRDGAGEDDFEIIIYDDDFPESEKAQYCPKCGAQNVENNMYCSKCGMPLKTGPVQTYAQYSVPVKKKQQYHGSLTQYGYQQSYSGHGANIELDSEIALYIGSNIDYYASAFTKLKTQNKQSSWNWCAFLFTPYWFVYRKMYGYGAAALGAALVLSFLGWIGGVLSLGGFVAIGILGNYLYMQQTERNINIGRSMSEPYKSQHLKKVGGTNTTATILTAIGYAILVSIIQFA